MHSPEPPIGAAGAPKPSVPEATYVFPKLEKDAVLFVEPNSHVAWLGIPLRQVDYLEAQAILDHSKYKIFQYYQDQKMKRLLQPSGALAQMKDFVIRKFK